MNSRNVVSIVVFVLDSLSSVADFSNTEARASTSAKHAPFLPAWRVMQFGQVVWEWVMVIFRWLFLFQYIEAILIDVWIQLWKQHFENLLGNPPKVTHEPITRIISKQLVIKLGQFTQEELNSVLRKIKNRKAVGLDEIPPEVWKTREFDDILLWYCNTVYNQNTNGQKDASSSSLRRTTLLD